MRFYTVLPFFLLSILLFTPLAEPLKAESLVGTKLFMGAQVFIEPGISAGRIDTLFMRMQENGMTMCRIRMFEAYMNYNGKWDFSLFDHAFDAAEKYGMKIYATFFPLTAKTDIGGWKFPVDQTQKEAFATYIKEVVNHYKNHPALYGWVLINEPGASSLAQQSEFIRTERQLSVV